MDSITQAVLGAAVGEAVLGKKLGNKAALWGAVGGTIPDLDVIFVPFMDAIQKISVHRGYSHSLVFCVLGGLFMAWIFSKNKKLPKVSYFRWWVFSFLALFTHVLLDAFTTYGTQLFLPVTDWRVSFDSINIVDPFYTLPLAAGLFATLVGTKKGNSRRGHFNTMGLIISSLYLLFTLAHKQHIETVFYDQIEAQNLPHGRLLTVPVKVGNMVWYGAVKTKDELYIGKYSELEKNRIAFEVFPVNEYLLKGLDKNLVDRMKWFAQGFYTVAEAGGKIRIYNLQCDMQGVRRFGQYKAPTAFYFEITPHPDGHFELTSGMHPEIQPN